MIMILAEVYLLSQSVIQIQLSQISYHSSKLNAQQQYLVVVIIIEYLMDQYLSIKIKDGLFIANKLTASDLEFLIANRFKYILNCTSEVKNYFETSNLIHYYKLKYSKQKPQIMWKHNFKKLNKIVQFINIAEQEAQCCLVHSNQGNNRCVAVIIAYLMTKYKWKLSKTIQFIQSKNIQHKLTENYIKQLIQLQETLSLQNQMSQTWQKKNNLSEEQLILTNTYLNSIEIPFQKITLAHNCQKKVKWKDRISKQQDINKQEKNKKNMDRQQLIDKTQKISAKSQLIQIKKQQLISYAKQIQQKSKRSHRPLSSFSNNINKNKQQRLSEKPKQFMHKEDYDDSSTDEKPHDKLINNFMVASHDYKKNSNKVIRKSEDYTKLTRALSDKNYNSFKQSCSKNMKIDISKRSLKASVKNKQYKIEKDEPKKQTKKRGVSPKINVVYKS